MIGFISWEAAHWLRALGAAVVIVIAGCQAGGELGDPPAAPQLSAAPGDRSIRVEWPAVEGAGAYYLYRLDSAQPTVRAVQSRQLATSPLVLDGLTNGATYYLGVTAIGQGGESAFSEIVEVTPQPPPAAPQNVVVSTGNGSVALQWDASTGAQTYRVYRLRGGTPTDGDIAAAPGYEGLNSAVESGFVADGLDNGVEYSFVVTAVNQSGESEPSTIVTATPGPIRMLSTGKHHACAIDSEYRAWCWGDNADAQLGQNAALLSPTPLEVTGVDGWRLVAAGERYTCGVSLDEALICWGGSGGLQMVADAPPRTRTTSVASYWRSIAMGADNGCGVQSDGVLWCWSFESSHSGNSSNAALKRIGLSSEWLDVFVNDQNWCARKQDLSLWCWGENSVGQLGTSMTVASNVPIAVAPESRFVQISVGKSGEPDGFTNGTGYSHVCGIDVDGVLWCWGFNRYGQLGNGQTEDGKSPQRLVGAKPWSTVAAGGHHTCGVQVDGTLWCWGSNEFGALGLEQRADYLEPTQVGQDTDWRQVYAGLQFTCAMKANGAVWCVGRNNYAQLGDGAAPSESEPSVVLVDVIDFAAAASGACAVRTGGTTWCWGEVALARGRESARVFTTERAPAPIGALPEFETLSANPTYDDVCGRARGGELWCFRLANPSERWRSDFSFDLKELALGQSAICALGSGANLYCGFGIYSISELSQALAPLGKGVTWSSIAAGSSFACAVSAAGSLECFGVDNGGVVGTGGTGFSLLEPIQLIPLFPDNDWKAVATGYWHACAIDVADDLWCWGSGDRGQLGVGPDPDYSVQPHRVDDGPWRLVRAANQATCAVKEDGSLWCWGNHAVGLAHPEMASGRFARVDRPQQVGTATDWIDVALGQGFGCGLRAGGQLHCWGVNNLGQVGDGKAWSTEWVRVDFAGE